ncbi:type I-D CRISPR-associated protein Cas7/Csc2 [Natrarchaeobius halalkaliphilus]|uniref:Type I-D CRISPR-associated protein Cas7/Csc2 n=1 Tax=Natrarchaeobius halalkaliphilus TaxID=1679091 RepID=A0A3N6MC01_9EURY|nr:type I-D CRISPR-associated protein Cas7/Csc2 [Natrarchaeobius halalkaliphilus]RQG93011.1 type I-D CRISPR-associated protein Cas7/Csc2 [Natrarchaeobius halalkaliphilus]
MLPESITTALESGTVPIDEMTNTPGTNYTTILALRELESHAIFTTNGEDADIASLSVVGEDASIEYSPGIMFMRKQTGSDRRMGKAIQRELLDYEEDDSMEVNNMNPRSVESALYGSAASGDDDVDIGVTSRVMYDTAFSVRDASACIDEKFQNAPGEDYAKGSRSTIREPDFFEPGSLFPCAITLRDATPAEVAFVVAITKRNKRYGAATTRLGRVKNHILGVYTGSEEGPSNRELTANVITSFAADSDYTLGDVVQAPALDISEASEYVRDAYDAACTEEVAQNPVDQAVVNELIEVAADDELEAILEAQRPHSEEFIEDAIATDGD